MAFTMDVDDLNEQEVLQPLQPEPEVLQKIDSQAEANAKEVMDVDLDSLEQRRQITSMIDGFGTDIVRKSSEKNELLATTLGTLSKQGGESSQVVNSLTDLDRQIRDLDPSGIDFGRSGFFAKFTNPVRNYFQKFEKADGMIENILENLERGKRTLMNDNTTLEIEQMSLRDLTKKLNKQIELGTQMDASLERSIEQAKVTNADPDRIKFAEEEILFPLRQKVMDMQQMQAVNQQGYLSMEIVRRNNKELIRAVERAQNVTVSALRTAVTVASALYNQKIVLEKVQAVNKTTNDLIKSTSEMLKTQGAQIQQTSMEANISVDTLKEAFRNTFDAMDAIDAYKQTALPRMKEQIEAFRDLANQGEARIQRIEKGAMAAPQIEEKNS